VSEITTGDTKRQVRRFIEAAILSTSGNLAPMDGPEVTAWEMGPPPGEEAVLARLAADGMRPHGWDNRPGDRYGWHEHAYHKVLYCVRGTITFHVPGADLLLRQGDRLDLPPGTPHAATVGAEGVRCVEAPSKEET